MKKLIYFGMGLFLCLFAALWTGCDKDKEKLNESTLAENGEENYVETAFGMKLQMVYVEGGTFMMGATEEQGDDAEDNERPAHRVTLDSYYIGKYEVTQSQWKAVMDTIWPVSLYWGDDYRMGDVSWYDAVAFCEKLSQLAGKMYRLPTEAEWEYAARGGHKTDGTKYAGSNDIGEVGWYDENYSFPFVLVGQKKPNGLGLYDMSGNAHEWCLDWYGKDYYSESPTVNPQGPSSGAERVLRGGGVDAYAQECRVSSRCSLRPIGGNAPLGFRIVCEAK